MRTYLNALFLLAACSTPKKTDEAACRNYRQLRAAAETTTAHILKELQYRVHVYRTDVVRGEERARPLLERAEHILAQICKVDSSMNAIEQQLIEEGGGFDGKINDVRRYSEQGIAYSALVQRHGARPLATGLKELMNDTRDTLLKYGHTSKNELDTMICEHTRPDAKNEQAWEETRFDRSTSLGAALATLAGIRLEMVNAGSMVINTLLGHFEAPGGCVIEPYDVGVVAHKSLIPLGEEYIATITLPDMDRAAPCQMSVAGRPIDVVSGTGFYRARPQKAGEYTWKAAVCITTADGAIKEYNSAPQTYTITSTR